MSDLLGIGKSGVIAYRTALTAVSENVANAETEGYARRVVVLKESSVSSAKGPLERSRATFGGVDASGVQRVWDDFKAADARLASGEAGRADARLRWLTTAENALDDGDVGVGTRLTAVFTAAEALASDPDGELPRRTFLAALDDAASTVRSTAESLARTADGIATEAQNAVDATNADLVALAKVNLDIHRAGAGTSAFAALADQRDRLIDGISGRLGIEARIENDGTATIKLAGSTGTTLLEGVNPALMGMEKSVDGRLSLVLSGNQSPTTIWTFGGSLAGLIDAAAMVSDRRAQLDSIAQNFAAGLNAWQVQGRDANGQPGAPLLAITGGAATLALATGDPGAIAAASADGVRNGNLLALSPLRGADGAEQRWGALIAGHAQIVASAKSEDAAASSRRDSAFAARDAVGGVDLDREAADLLRYQQAYNGSAKIIQVARETLQAILDII